MNIRRFPLLVLFAPALFAQSPVPQWWCQELPRAQYKTLARVPVHSDWFEVYQPADGVFAIYEPHQSEETISYLIVGQRSALLFDTGMGIADLKKVTSELTRLPIVVLNSHTHADHVGANWQFDAVYGMDTDFTRANARGSREAAQEEVAPSEICGQLPAGFDPKAYATRPWKIEAFKHDGDRIDLGGRMLEIITTPGHTPDAICLFDRANGLLFTGDTYYPGPIWLHAPETDLAAYDASIRKLAALAPRVKIVLGAHNAPVSPPSVLAELVTAFEAARSGKVPAVPASSGKVTYASGDFTFLLAAPKGVAARTPAEQIGVMLDDWHQAASVADLGRYFSHFAPDGVFIGTDATERWTVPEFIVYVKERFDSKSNWTFHARERHIAFSTDGKTAWFDEMLETSDLGLCRASGVVALIDGEWKIAHYDLSIPIPNAMAREIVKQIGAK
jgi:glyoxylase-like metal-dependent hydrolase (beta-lactamase superfamily II)